MSKGTSLNSVYLFSGVLVFCTCVIALSASGTLRNAQESTIPKDVVQRVKRQFNGNAFGGGFDGGRRRGPPRRGPGGAFFQNSNTDFGRQQPFNGGSNELIFSGGPSPNIGIRANDNDNNNNSNNNNINNNNNNSGNNQTGQLVFINNRPTIATMAPFVGRTTASPQFISCFNSCRTTSEYNPICGSDQELYFNEQKFNCAQRCGADIQIVRRGSCQGLFPMMRG